MHEDMTDEEEEREERYWVACHEAGHAIAGVFAARALCGNDLGFWSLHLPNPAKGEDMIVRERSVHGRTEQHKHYVLLPREFRRLPTNQWTVQAMHWTIKTALAGGIAELRAKIPKCAVKRNWKEQAPFEYYAYQVGVDDDLEHARGVLEALNDYQESKNSPPYEMETFYWQTRDLLHPVWNAIDALGKVLAEAYELNFDEAIKVIAPHLPSYDDSSFRFKRVKCR